MGVTKKQHYVSRGILKHFENDTGRVFELLLDKEMITSKRINETMAQNYVYEHPLFATNALENKFQEIESFLFPELDAMIINLEQDYRSSFLLAISIFQMLP